MFLLIRSGQIVLNCHRRRFVHTYYAKTSCRLGPGAGFSVVLSTVVLSLKPLPVDSLECSLPGWVGACLCEFLYSMFFCFVVVVSASFNISTINL